MAGQSEQAQLKSPRCVWSCEMVALEDAAATLPGGNILWLDFDAFLEECQREHWRKRELPGLPAADERIREIARGPLMRRYSKALDHEYGPDARRQLLDGSCRQSRSSHSVRTCHAASERRRTRRRSRAPSTAQPRTADVSSSAASHAPGNRECRRIAASASFVDGRITNPHNTAKQNEQLHEVQDFRRARNSFAGLGPERGVPRVCLSGVIAPPLLTRYRPGMKYGAHSDSAFLRMPGLSFART